ncbi:MAG TPA: thermonuclease family protein [Bradyrhizobium sp.]|nr:thermonuclease family protein [Bradyrhizobium sp.]
MRSRNALLPAWLAAVSALLVVIGLGVVAGPASAASAVVRDGNTIQLGNLTYRLDGIDAPELDQNCIDDHADPWSCGTEARDQLAKLIGGRPVHCDDHGPDKNFRKRHLGVCSVTGETASLNQEMIAKGFALDLASSAKDRFAKDQASAKSGRLGLWKGCFVSPQEFRHGKKDGALLGGSCRADKDREIRAVLFPEHPAMPPGCSIKARFAIRARLTGNVGIYHLQGCPSYPATTRPDRWFCSEDDARAQGFRRAYNCRTRK